MGFLNPEEQIVNATLTKKGRELLAKGDGRFKISKFAISDDEIDYSQWNTDHVSGSDWYGEVIEASPIFEALPDETIVMRYKLVTLPKGSTSIPYVVVSPAFMSLTYLARGIVKPSTLNGGPGYNDANGGYTCILHNKSIASLRATRVAPGQTPRNLQISEAFNDETAVNSEFAVGLEFEIVAKNVTNIAAASRTSLITVYGNESGTSAVLTLTITPPPHIS